MNVFNNLNNPNQKNLNIECIDIDAYHLLNHLSTRSKVC